MKKNILLICLLLGFGLSVNGSKAIDSEEELINDFNRLSMQEDYVTFNSTEIPSEIAQIGSMLVSGLDDDTAHLHKQFNDIYYDLVKKGVFGINYPHKLILSSEFLGDPQADGMALIALRSWLNDLTHIPETEHTACITLAKTLDRLCFLRFHQFLSSMDLKHPPISQMFNLCHELYNHKVKISRPGKPAREEGPFRGCITKLYLIITMFNDNLMRYENRKESLAYLLNRIKREMLTIKRELMTLNNELITINHHLDDQIKIDDIRTFISLLITYTVYEPAVKPANIKKWFFYAILAGCAAYGIHWLVFANNGQNAKWLKTKMKEIGNYIAECIAEPIGRGVAAGAAEKMGSVMDPSEEVAKLEKEVKKAQENNDPEEAKELLNKIEKLRKNAANMVKSLETMGAKITVGILDEAKKPETKELAKEATKELGSQIVKGLTQEVLELLDPSKKIAELDRQLKAGALKDAEKAALEKQIEQLKTAAKEFQEITEKYTAKATQNWLDKVANPDNKDMKQAENQAVAAIIRAAVKGAKEGATDGIGDVNAPNVGAGIGAVAGTVLGVGPIAGGIAGGVVGKTAQGAYNVIRHPLATWQRFQEWRNPPVPAAPAADGKAPAIVAAV